MNEVLEKIVKATKDGILGIGIDVICGPVAPLAESYIETIKEIFENEKTSHILTVKECEDIFPENRVKYVPIFVTAVELCIEQLDLIESYNYKENKCVEEISKQYINRYCNHFGEEELGVLKNFLAVIIEKTLVQLQIEQENDPEFRIKFKQAVSKKFQEIDTTIEKHSTEIKDIKEELKYNPSEKNLVNECHEKYKRDWNKKMFLTPDIKLSDLHMLSYYQDEQGDKKIDLHSRLKKVLDSGNDVTERMLLILGHPGSGKSTLMTYILNNYSLERFGRTVRMYCFRNFDQIDWNGAVENLFSQMLHDMGLSRNDLNNSVLILDGLDEVNMSNNQIEFLNSIYEDWVESSKINNFSLVVTCRINRIENEKDLECPYLKLLPLEPDQIIGFVTNYNFFVKNSKNTKRKIQKLLEENKDVEEKDSLKEVLGIPLILYMVLALDIELKEEKNLVEVYEQIFSIENKNSIYKKRNYDHKAGHPITQEKVKEIHQFSKDIAMNIWENNPKEAVVEKKEYLRIAKRIVPNGNINDLLIGQYFMEGKDSFELYFVHRSMYEYFVALSIYDSIYDMIHGGTVNEQFQELMEEDRREKHSPMSEFARMIGMYNLSAFPEIKEYLSYMLQRLEIENQEWCKEILALFLENGFTYYVDHYKEKSLMRIQNENNRFYNLVWLIQEQLIKIDKTCLHYEVAKVDEMFCYYLKQGSKAGVDLRGANLSGVDLRRGNLQKANLSGVDLRLSYLNDIDLRGANLQKANLENVNLERGNLKDANFEKINLEFANLQDTDLKRADLRGANLREVHMDNANLEVANLSGVDLREAHMDNVNLKVANLIGANLRGVDMNNANLQGTDLQGSDLRGANLQDTDLKRADLRGANLQGADLRGSNLQGVDLRRAHLTKNNLECLNLTLANLSGLDLSEINLQGADLRSSNLSGTNLQGANLQETNLQNANLRGTDLRGSNLIGAIFSRYEVKEAFLDKEIRRKYFPEEFFQDKKN